MSDATTIKWTKPENIHFTLAFLGDTPEEKLQIISDKLQVITKKFKPFDIKLVGLGFFPNFHQPRILWIGAESSDLINLAASLHQELKQTGFKIDDKPFKSHLTIARIKFIDPHLQEKLSSIVGEYKEKEFGCLETKSVEIMESVLFPSGPVYKSLEKIPL